MNEQVEPTTPKAEKQATPFELANSWLDFRTSEVQRRIEQTGQSIEFTSTYEPKPSVRPSYVDPGSMDALDWEVAELEYEQWPYEQEEELDRLHGEMDDLHDELSAIADHRQKIADGDERLTKVFAEKEAERRAKIAEEERLAAERKRIQEEKAKGKEMEGATEVEAQLQKVTNLVRSKQVVQYKRGENGWQSGWSAPKDRYNSREIFDFDANDRQLMVRVYSDEGEGFSVEIDDFRTPQPPPEKRKYRVDIGNCMRFTVKEGRVRNWHKGKTERSYQWGYPEYRGLPAEEPFEQTDFDNARKMIGDLVSDITSLPTQPKAE